MATLQTRNTTRRRATKRRRLSWGAFLWVVGVGILKRLLIWAPIGAAVSGTFGAGLASIGFAKIAVPVCALLGLCYGARGLRAGLIRSLPRSYQTPNMNLATTITVLLFTLAGGVVGLAIAGLPYTLIGCVLGWIVGRAGRSAGHSWAVPVCTFAGTAIALILAIMGRNQAHAMHGFRSGALVGACLTPALVLAIEFSNAWLWVSQKRRARGRMPSTG